MLKQLTIEVLPEEWKAMNTDPRFNRFATPLQTQQVIEKVMNIDLSGYRDHQIEIKFLSGIRCTFRDLFRIAQDETETPSARRQALVKARAEINKLRKNCKQEHDIRQIDEAEEQLVNLERLFGMVSLYSRRCS